MIKAERLRKRVGHNLKESVKKRFLLTRHLEQYLDPFSSIETNFHLLLPKLGYIAAYAKQFARDKLIEYKQYIAKSGDDMPEIREWTWKYADT